MGAATQPRAFRPAAGPRPRLALIEEPSRPARLHLFTYVVGNALFWVVWATISVTADHWYWWAAVPLAGWTIVLGLQLLNSRRLLNRPERR